MKFAKIPRDQELRIATYTLNNKLLDHCSTLPKEDAKIIIKIWKDLLKSIDYNIIFD
ncbi:MAG: hypothetical protein GOVbin2604_64 [Gammaproteobacteria virus GOV_bin_2604]|nr:MAG: hypothetical protein GOVbin2604_64 [Gammaproteobacteria virus GOV_bin_2604]